MKDYELTIIAKVDEKATAALTTKIKGWIEAAKGKIEKSDSWGTKTLAYPIDKQTEGSYLFFAFSIDPKSVSTIENKLKLETEVIRHLLVVK